MVALILQLLSWLHVLDHLLISSLSSLQLGAYYSNLQYTKGFIINYENVSANYLPRFTWHVVMQCCVIWLYGLILKACGTLHDILLNAGIHFDQLHSLMSSHVFQYLCGYCVVVPGSASAVYKV